MKSVYATYLAPGFPSHYQMVRKARGQCGRARSFIFTGVNPVPARQARHREESLGLAGVIPKVKAQGNRANRP